MNLILPCAGKSSRFPNMRPKWSLTHPNGNLMIIEAIKGLNLNKFNHVYMVILKEHLNNFVTMDGLFKAFLNINIRNKIKIIALNNPTKNQPETVYQLIKKFENVNPIKGAIYIKDCDNYFETELSSENEISISDLNDLDMVCAKNKSYVISDENDFISTIVEKQVISSTFCCGGYSFNNVNEFVKYYELLSNEKELYISHIIYKMMLDGIKFKINKTKNYIDWGTLADWTAYKSDYRVLLIDMDGILVKNSGEYFSPAWGDTDGIENNIKYLNELYDGGKTQIIITTARKEKYKDITLKQLEKFNVKYHKIVFGLLHSKRIVINDFAKTNNYPSCESINITRNNPNLKDFL